MKDLIFKLNRKVEKGERNDKMTRRTKSKAFLVRILDLEMHYLMMSSIGMPMQILPCIMSTEHRFPIFAGHPNCFSLTNLTEHVHFFKVEYFHHEII